MLKYVHIPVTLVKQTETRFSRIREESTAYVTAAYEINQGVLKFAVSCSSPQDAFSKPRGRSISRSRLQNPQARVEVSISKNPDWLRLAEDKKNEHIVAEIIETAIAEQRSLRGTEHQYMIPFLPSSWARVDAKVNFIRRAHAEADAA
jgi:hypothetical protein